MNDDPKDIILSAFEASLEAQLRAIRRLRTAPRRAPPRAARKVCLKLTWLSTYSRRPAPPYTFPRSLVRIHFTFQATVDRESLVSSLTKKVARGDRFLRTGKNTFGLRPEVR